MFSNKMINRQKIRKEYKCNNPIIWKYNLIIRLISRLIIRLSIIPIYMLHVS
jgi:hypothetical protein